MKACEIFKRLKVEFRRTKGMVDFFKAFFEQTDRWHDAEKLKEFIALGASTMAIIRDFAASQGKIGWPVPVRYDLFVTFRLIPKR